MWFVAWCLGEGRHYGHDAFPAAKRGVAGKVPGRKPSWKGQERKRGNREFLLFLFLMKEEVPPAAAVVSSILRGEPYETLR